MSRIGDLLTPNYESSPRIVRPLSVNELLNPAPTRKRPPLDIQLPQPKRQCYTTPEVVQPALSPHSPTISDASTISATNSEVSQCPDSPDITAPQDRFTSSRIIGQKHRDKEYELRGQLEEQVEKLLIDKNLRIVELFIERLRYGLSSKQLAYLRVLLKKEVRENRDQSYHRVSEKSAAILGAEYWSGAMALILLDMISTRRNLVDVPRESGKRRRKDTLECAPEGVFDQMMNTAIGNLKSTMNLSSEIVNELPEISKDQWCLIALEWVKEAHEIWSNHEDSSNPPKLKAKELRFPPDSDSVLIGNRAVPYKGSNDKGDLKRCTRCKKGKTAGKGHRRGKCDDGIDIASKIPYPNVSLPSITMNSPNVLSTVPAAACF